MPAGPEQLQCQFQQLPARAQAQALTCSIFYTLMAKFRGSLKAEVGLFFPMMLLRAIEPAAIGTTPNMAGEAGQSAF